MPRMLARAHHTTLPPPPIALLMAVAPQRPMLTSTHTTAPHARQDVAHASWSLSTTNRYHAPLFAALAAHAAATLPALLACPPALDTVVGALSAAGGFTYYSRVVGLL
jgi:hypothetical protein